MEKFDIHKKLILCTSKKLEERVETYHSLTEIFCTLPQPSDWGSDITKDVAHTIINNIKQDLFNPESGVCYEATGFLGCYLANERLMDLLTVEEEQEIIDLLLKLLKETNEKTVLTRGLWSLAQSKFECEIYSKNLTSLLSFFNDILKGEPTNLVIYEALQVVKSLMESVPETMIDKIEDWIPKIFEYLFHEVLKVRGIAYSCLNFCQLYTQERKCLNILNRHVVPFIPALKSRYCKQMINLLEENCSFILKIWRLLVIILGQNLHSGTTLINGFLEVVEKAFKCSKAEFRIDAFKCWHVLIGNFSTDIGVLAHPKRLKLLIAPFKSNNAKTEDIALIKLHTWWFLVCKLEGNIDSYFELIVVPLLKFTFDHNRISQISTNERKFLMAGSSTCCTEYPSLILKSVEILCNLLNHNQTLLNNFNFSLNYPTLNNTLFMKNHHLIFGCVADSLMNLNSTNSHHLKIAQEILQSLLNYVNAISKEYLNKKESIDVVREFLRVFDYIESECKPGDSVALFCYEFVNLSLIGSQALSSNVLQSRFYHIPVKSKIRDIMNGCLANYFIHKLCRPVLLYCASSEPGFLEIWNTVVLKGKSSNKLEFFESVIEELENALPYLFNEAPDVLVSLWISTATALDSFIEETQQINQGDNSDHDWTCIYSILMFPLHCSQDLHCVKDTSYKNLIAAWTKLWSSFTSLTALTATAEPNCESEFITKNMHSKIREFASSSKSCDFAAALFAEVISLITDKFRFKQLWSKQKILHSPSAQKKKANPLSNLSSLVEVVIKLMQLSIEMVSFWRNKTMHKICESLMKIFKSIVQEQLAWIVVSNLIEVLKMAVQINPQAKFNGDTEKSFVSMWNSFCGLIECRIVPKLTQDKLTKLSPLICAALQSSHVSLRQRTRLMWSTSFASTSLRLPKSLVETLESVNLSPNSVMEANNEDSQFLIEKDNKIASRLTSLDIFDKKKESPISSPKIDFKLKLSPNSSTKRPSTYRNKQKQKAVFGIDELKSGEFVVVTSPKINKRVLSKRQKEKMKERSVDIPALYNDMSQSLSQMPSDNSSQAEFSVKSGYTSTDKCPSHSRTSFEGKLDASVLPELNDSVINDSKNYSDEDLNDVLRDTSLELEKSLSDSVIILEKEDEELTHKPPGSNHKRKSQTPSRKTIIDIKRKLKGNLRSSKSLDKLTSSNIESSLENEDSPLASPLSSPHKNFTSNSSNKKGNNEKKDDQSPIKVLLKDRNSENNDQSFKNLNKSCSISEDEIPSSQAEITNETNIMSPSSNRPRRNKRKGIFEDSDIYVTPKRSKLALSPKTEGRPTRIQMPVLLDQEIPNDDQLKQNLTNLEKNENTKIKNIDKKTSSLDDLSHYDKEESLPTVSSTPGTPCKITRSGRRIVAPNRDMPEPMTPPGLKFKRKDNESQEHPSLSNDNDHNMENTNIGNSRCQTPDKSTNSTLLNDKEDSHANEKENNFEMKECNKLTDCNEVNKITNENNSKNHDYDFSNNSITSNKSNSKKNIEADSPIKSKKNVCSYSAKRKRLLMEETSNEKLLKLDENVNEIKISQNLNISKQNSPSNRKRDLGSCSPNKDNNGLKSLEIDEVNMLEASSKSITDLSLNNSDYTTNNLNFAKEKNTEIISIKSVTKEKKKPANTRFCNAIHITNGGIVFTKAGNLQKTLPIQRTLRKCKSLEKFSPTKGSGDDIFSNWEKTKRKILVDAEMVENSCQVLEKLLPQNEFVSVNGETTTPSDVSNPSEKSNNLLEANCQKDLSTILSNNNSNLQMNNKVESSTSKISLLPKQFCGPPDLNGIPLLKHEAKRILIISSPKNSSFPVKKVVYSSQTREECLKPNNSEIYFISKGNVKSDLQLNNNTDNSTQVIDTYSKETGDSLKDDVQLNNNADNSTCVINTYSKETGDSLKSKDSFHFTDDNLDKSKENFNSSEDRTIKRDSRKDIGAKLSKKKSRSILKKKIKCGKISPNNFSLLSNLNIDQNHIEKNILSKDIENCKSVEDLKIVCEKESPDKMNCKLSNSIGTPERKKFTTAKVHLKGTRAALMLACAKKHIRSRDDLLSSDDNCNDINSEAKITIGDEDENDLLNQVSPSITPSRENLLEMIVLDGRPWAKHEPSPKASPCGSILKKRQIEDYSSNLVGDVNELGESSPSVFKNRRVSFADPPVSERVEIPPMQHLKSHKAQKRLDMSQALRSINCDFGMIDDTEEPFDYLVSTPSCSQPIYKSLLGCSEPIDDIIPMLTTTTLVESLKIVFRDRGIRTVGDLSALSEAELESFPVRSPKSTSTAKCLEEFEKLLTDKRDKKLSNSDSTSNETSAELDSSGNSEKQKKSLLNGSTSSKDEKCIIDVETLDSESSDLNATNDCSHEDTSIQDKMVIANDCSHEDTSIQDKMVIDENIIEDESSKKLCDLISKDESALLSFIEGLSDHTKLNLFNGLTKVIPYQDLIDLFHQYLTRQKINIVNNQT